jgi:hypothetical protein
MGIYILFIYGGNSVGSLLAGFIINGAGWRWFCWFCWFCAIISGLNLLAIFIFVHETPFNRVHEETNSIHESGSSDKGFIPAHVEKVNSSSSSAELTDTKKTLLQNLGLWSGTSKESYLSHFLRPFLLVVYPAVVWGILSCKSSFVCHSRRVTSFSILDSLCLAWQISVNSLSSFVFQEPPYNFSPGVNGLINIPVIRKSLKTPSSSPLTVIIVGNLLGAFLGGYLTDTYARYSAKRNSGSFSPESRLVLLIFPSFLGPTGLLMFGFGAQQKLHWSVLFVGYAFINVVNGVANIGMTYVMDSYFEVAAESLLLVNGMKNVAGWAFTYGFIPWTESVGYQTVSDCLWGKWEGCVNLVIGLWRYGGDLFGGYADGCSAVFLRGELEKLYFDEDESYLLVMVYPALKRRTSRQLFTLSYITRLTYSGHE